MSGEGGEGEGGQSGEEGWRGRSKTEEAGLWGCCQGTGAPLLKSQETLSGTSIPQQGTLPAPWSQDKEEPGQV